MARILLAGTLWGTAIGAAGLLGAHLAFPVATTPPTVVPTDAPAPVASAPVVGDVASNVLPPVLDTPSDAAPTVNVPEAQVAAPDADTQTAARPVIGGQSSGVEGPAAAAPLGVEVQVEAPVLPAPQAAAPTAPSDEDGSAPIAVDTQSSAAPDDEGPVEAPKGVETPAPETTEVPESVDLPSDKPEVGFESSGGTIGDLAEGVKVNRSAAQDTAREAEVAASALPQVTPTGRAIVDFAAPADVDPSKPLMALVLLDDGTSTLDLVGINSFPFPVSFGVKATAPTATARAALYRSADLEVLSMIDVLPTATPADLEVAFEAVSQAVPEAVGIFETSDGVLQRAEDLRGQVTDIAADKGWGVMTYQTGLNSFGRVAAQKDVPTAQVFRDLDPAGQDGAVIRRFLDHAAFKAAQKGAIVLVARARSETVEAILQWGQGQRASRVSLVPVSVVLQAR
ncbi:divergent polysaccharide deacetylase family protein [Nereida sp.]|uniref:divergent polysaccharide deacetylase family protein n=1 Tax=Nereida sp. TaxID=2736090 RepID=UPI003F697C36